MSSAGFFFWWPPSFGSIGVVFFFKLDYVHSATFFLRQSITMTTYARLVRFVPASAPSSQPLIGEPCDELVDVGLAAYGSQPIEVEVFSGSSILQPGHRTGKKEHVKTLLSPLAAVEVGTIRCIGLNVSRSHAHSSSIAEPVLLSST